MLALATVKKHTVVKRPVGTSAAIASLLVVIANMIGLDLDATQAAAIIGGIAALVSLIKPII